MVVELQGQSIKLDLTTVQAVSTHFYPVYYGKVHFTPVGEELAGVVQMTKDVSIVDNWIAAMREMNPDIAIEKLGSTGESQLD